METSFSIDLSNNSIDEQALTETYQSLRKLIQEKSSYFSDDNLMVVLKRQQSGCWAEILTPIATRNNEGTVVSGKPINNINEIISRLDSYFQKKLGKLKTQSESVTTRKVTFENAIDFKKQLNQLKTEFQAGLVTLENINHTNITLKGHQDE